MSQCRHRAACPRSGPDRRPAPPGQDAPKDSDCPQPITYAGDDPLVMTTDRVVSRGRDRSWSETLQAGFLLLIVGLAERIQTRRPRESQSPHRIVIILAILVLVVIAGRNDLPAVLAHLP